MKKNKNVIMKLLILSIIFVLSMSFMAISYASEGADNEEQNEVMPIDVKLVSGEQSLREAIAGGGEVKLNSDITVTESYIDITSSIVTLNLNGHNITRDTETGTALIRVSGDKTLNITGSGELAIKNSNADNAFCVAVYNGTLNVEGNDVKMKSEATKEDSENGEACIYVDGDTNPDGETPKVTIEGGTFTAYSCVNVIGKSKTTINNGTFNAKRFPVATWGDDTDKSKEITINNGNFYGGLFFPADGTYIINNGTFEANDGYSALEIKRGTLTIKDGNFTADASQASGDLKVNGGGAGPFTGAVVVSKSDAYSGDVKVTIEGGTFTNDKGDAIVMVNQATKEGHGSSIEIASKNNDITINGNVADYTGEDNANNTTNKVSIGNNVKVTGDIISTNSDNIEIGAGAEIDGKIGPNAKISGDSFVVYDLNGNSKTYDFDGIKKAGLKISAGFKEKADEANKALNAALQGDTMRSSGEINDSVKNTAYIVLSNRVRGNITLNVFNNSGNKIYYESISGEERGCRVFYFAFPEDGSGDLAKSQALQKFTHGKYTVKITAQNSSGESSGDIADGELNIYQVNYTAGEGVSGDPLTIYVAEGDDLDKAKSTYPEGYTKINDNYTWQYDVKQDTDNCVCTVEVKAVPKSSSNSGSSSGGGSGVTKYKITVTVGPNGNVTPSGNVRVEKGKDQRFDITPNNGYVVEDVKVDGKSVGAVTSYTFEDVTKAHTLSVTFKAGTGTTPTDPSTTNTRYADVARNAWFYNAIEYVSEKGLMQGTGANKFDPDVSVTRGMMAAVLYRLSGTNTNGTSTFTDVPAGSYYSNAIAWAAEKGIVTGVGENRFDPERAIKREEMATMIARYISTMEVSIETTGETGSAYADAGTISSFATEAVNTMKTTGLMEGKNGNNFDPAGLATRAEVATILMRFVEKTTTK